MDWMEGYLCEWQVLLVLVGVLTILVWPRVRSYQDKQENKEKIRRKREIMRTRKAALEESLSINGDLLDQSKQDIISLNVKHLLDQLKTGVLSPVQVLQAFQSKALIVDKQTNAVCDFILEALDQARHLETIPKDERGPLYGLPISVKECFLVKGYDATVGLASLLFKPADKDCDFVKLLKDLHAVPFCTTNVSQLLFTINSSNPVYGQTTNPHNPALSSGGSSGGEGALIGGGGSLLGIGTDIGGSVRIPAHINGICSLKPTPGRLCMSGMRTSVGVGNEAVTNGIYSVNGFLSSNMDGLEVAMRSVLSNSEKMAQDDWRVVPLQWREELFVKKNKLKVGWYDFDGVFPAAPSCKRAVHGVVKLLKEDGHEVVQWMPPMLPQARDTFFRILIDNGADGTLKVLKSEEVDPSINELKYIYGCPAWLKRIFASLVRLFSNTLAEFFLSVPHSGAEVWKHNATRDNLIYQFTRSWQAAGYDVLICPGLAHPAFPPKYGNWLSGSSLPGTSYTCVYNLLGCPVGALNITKQNEEDEDMSEEVMKEDSQNRQVGEILKHANGCPVGVQVVGRHFQEETVLNVMKLIEGLNKCS